MICMDDGLLADQVVFPLFHTLHQGINLLVIGGIVYHSLRKLLRMVTNWLLFLHEYSSHGITVGIISIPNGCWRSGRAKTGAVLIFSFNVSKDFCCLPPHWKTCFTLVNVCKGVAITQKLAINLLQY